MKAAKDVTLALEVVTLVILAHVKDVMLANVALNKEVHVALEMLINQMNVVLLMPIVQLMTLHYVVPQIL